MHSQLKTSSHSLVQNFVAAEINGDQSNTDQYEEPQGKKRSRQRGANKFDEISEQILNWDLLDSKERRRERNKLLARRARLRNKCEEDGLREELARLMRENAELHSQFWAAHFPAVTAEELTVQDIELPRVVVGALRSLFPPAPNSIQDETAEEEKIKHVPFCVMNGVSKRFPIVYASPALLERAGYSRAEVIGRNGLFFHKDQYQHHEEHRHQQKSHDEQYHKQALLSLERAVTCGADTVQVLQGFRKTGEMFWDQVRLIHLKDSLGQTFLVIAIHLEVPAPSPLLPLCSTILIPATANKEQAEDAQGKALPLLFDSGPATAAIASNAAAPFIRVRSHSPPDPGPGGTAGTLDPADAYLDTVFDTFDEFAPPKPQCVYLAHLDASVPQNQTELPAKQQPTHGEPGLDFERYVAVEQMKGLYDFFYSKGDLERNDNGGSSLPTSSSNDSSFGDFWDLSLKTRFGDQASNCSASSDSGSSSTDSLTRVQRHW